ncbi:MAG: DHA2 family efflux MFS transporter permease subunit [Acidimicrobiales bacterium]
MVVERDVVRMGTAPGRFVLAATIGGSALAALDATVVNVALPSIGDELDASLAGLQWVITGYMLALASLILVGGSLGDRYGRRRVFVVGVVWFSVASLLCGIAPTLPLLVAARILQGVGGALLTPGSLAIIQAGFHPEDRGRAVGAWSGLGGVATAVGPFAGGWLIQYASWRWVFLINLPVAAGVVLLARHVPETRDPATAGRIDVAGAVTATLGLGALTLALTQAGSVGWTTGVIAGLVVGAVATVAFVVLQRREHHPLVPLRLFSSRQFAAANVVTFGLYAALAAATFLLVVQLQTSAGFSPLAAGTALLPVTFIMLVLSPRAGALAQRIGPRIPMAVGPIVTAAGLLLMTRIGPGASYLTDVLPTVIVFGLGLAGFVAPLTATVLAAAPTENASTASGINNAVARVGGLTAVAAIPIVAGLSGQDYLDPLLLTAGFRTTMIVAAVLAAGSGVLAWFTISSNVCRGRPRPSRQYVCAIDAAPIDVPELTTSGAR